MCTCGKRLSIFCITKCINEAWKYILVHFLIMGIVIFLDNVKVISCIRIFIPRNINLMTNTKQSFHSSMTLSKQKLAAFQTIWFLLFILVDHVLNKVQTGCPSGGFLESTCNLPCWNHIVPFSFILFCWCGEGLVNQGFNRKCN